MKWQICPLGDIITLKRGYDLPSNVRQEGDIPVVSSSGITGYHNEAKVKAPGVVTGRYGTLGEVFYLDRDYWPLNTALYVTDFKGNSPKFVAYFLRNILQNYQSDKAAVPGVNRNVLHGLKVHIPDLKSQEIIANMLSTYDDLIENNRRRMKLLEEEARLLYQEWFVDLHFPGHEHVKIEDGVPEGWEQKLLFDLATPTYGHPFQSSLFTEGGEGLPVVRIRDVLAGETQTFTVEEAPQDRRLQNGDFLIGMDGEFHMGLWAGGDAWLNQRVVRIKTKGAIDDYLLFWMLRDPIRAFNETITGTTVVHLGAKDLKSVCLLVPPRSLLTQTNELFKPMGKQIVTLKLQNQKLRAARDLLLPRLMSGEVSV